MAQIEEMLKYWKVQTVKQNRNIAQEQACTEWISLYAAHFHVEWSKQINKTF